MRKLTITRRKSHLLRLNRIKFFREEKEQNVSLFKRFLEKLIGHRKMIRGVSCIKIGTLKNGETKTFFIPDDEMRIYAIDDPFTTEYQYGCFRLPAETKDAVLTGEVKDTTGIGKVFLFDRGMRTDGMDLNRLKLILPIRNIVVGSIVASFGILILFSLILPIISPAEQSKTFQVDELQIILTDGFSEKPTNRFDRLFGSDLFAVSVIRYPIASRDGMEEMTLDEYIETYAKSNGFLPEEIHSERAKTFIEWKGQISSGETLLYRLYFFRSDKAFWAVQFWGLPDTMQEYMESIWRWVESVTFSE